MIIETRIPESHGNGGAGAAMPPLPPAPAAPAAPRLSGAAREYHNLVADLEDLIGEATSLTAEDLQRLRTQIGERIALARHAAEDLGGSIDQQARRTVSATNEYVHREPWNAIGIGVGAGLLLGILFARRG